jgi:hypothetical protein
MQVGTQPRGGNVAVLAVARGRCWRSPDCRALGVDPLHRTKLG